MAKSRDELIGRTITDPAFRAALLADPAKTLADNDFEVDPDVVTAIQAANAAQVEAGVAAFGQHAYVPGIAQPPPTCG